MPKREKEDVLGDWRTELEGLPSASPPPANGNGKSAMHAASVEPPLSEAQPDPKLVIGPVAVGQDEDSIVAAEAQEVERPTEAEEDPLQTADGSSGRPGFIRRHYGKLIAVLVFIGGAYGVGRWKSSSSPSAPAAPTAPAVPRAKSDLQDECLFYQLPDGIQLQCKKLAVNALQFDPKKASRKIVAATIQAEAEGKKFACTLDEFDLPEERPVVASADTPGAKAFAIAYADCFNND